MSIVMLYRLRLMPSIETLTIDEGRLALILFLCSGFYQQLNDF
jgi:hypothetical protein